MSIYNFFSYIPGISYVKRKINSKFENLENEIVVLSRQAIENRIQLKILRKERINVLFLCHRPAVWGSMKSIYENLCQDERFRVTIVTIPQINAEGRCEKEVGNDFFQGEHIIQGYDYEKKKFLDLKKLEPDYFFYQQPYNTNYIPEYRSNIISKYAKVCYLAYFTYMDNLTKENPYDECYPLDFLRDVSFYFAQYSSEATYLQNRLRDNWVFKPRIEITGYPKYDNLERYRDQDSTVWKHKEWEGHFRIVWTPRWTTNENCCHFFLYKDRMLELCRKYPEIELVFRPHPQSWIEWEHTGEFSKENAQEYKKQYKILDNASIDETPEYLGTFYHSNCLITDTSSLIPEYLLTGNPVIYCYSEKSTNKFEKGKGFSNAMYWVENWGELVEVLNKLKIGEDPLKKARQEIIKTYYIPEKSAGNKIADLIKEDAFA